VLVAARSAVPIPPSCPEKPSSQQVFLTRGLRIRLWNLWGFGAGAAEERRERKKSQEETWDEMEEEERWQEKTEGLVAGGAKG
jgi:hypothetical protein